SDVCSSDLEQVLDNLVANALEAVGPNGTITLSARADDRRVTVRVSDDGPGMTAAQRDRAFHRFVSGGDSRGTGLGLAIVHRLVTSDGGEVDITTSPSGGA